MKQNWLVCDLETKSQRAVWCCAVSHITFSGVSWPHIMINSPEKPIWWTEAMCVNLDVNSPGQCILQMARAHLGATLTATSVKWTDKPTVILTVASGKILDRGSPVKMLRSDYWPHEIMWDNKCFCCCFK